VDDFDVGFWSIKKGFSFLIATDGSIFAHSTDFLSLRAFYDVLAMFSLGKLLEVDSKGKPFFLSVRHDSLSILFNR
jgi:hypothetical protein